MATGSERFENLANGILSRNSNVTVTNSKFTNMLTDASYLIEGFGIATAGNENHSLTQTGLLDVTPLGVTFENCPVGIRTVGMNIVSSRNGMINVARGIEATNSSDNSGAAPVLLNFAATNQHTPIGKIAQVGVNLKAALLPNATLALDYQAKYEEVIDASSAYYDLTELYAAADAQEQVLLRPDLIQKTNELVQLNIELDSIRQLILTDQNTDLTNLLTFTSTIPEGILKVKNLKTIYTTLISKLLSSNVQLTATDITTLQLLANECPYTGGMAVFEAQGLLALDDQYGWLSYSCTGTGSKVYQSESTLYKATIHPNPAQDQINIDGLSFKEVDTYTIDIISIDGKLIKSVPISSGNHQVNTNDLTNGMYLINIHTDNRFISTQKLVIQR